MEHDPVLCMLHAPMSPMSWEPGSCPIQQDASCCLTCMMSLQGDAFDMLASVLISAAEEYVKAAVASSASAAVRFDDDSPALDSSPTKRDADKVCGHVSAGSYTRARELQLILLLCASLCLSEGCAGSPPVLKLPACSRWS